MKSRGFTLIELLVVISIIGMLASVVLASLSGARQKGMIGAGQQFDSSLYHAFGANAALVLDLNGTAVDGSGNGNTISTTPTDASALYTTGPTGASNSALLFGSGAVTSFIVNAPLKNFPSTNNGNTGNYSISIWVKPDAITPSDYQSLVSWGDAGHGTRAYLFMTTDFKVGFSQWWNDKASVASVSPGIWQQITLSFSLGVAKIYLNGKLADTLQMYDLAAGEHGTTGAPTLSPLAPTSAGIGVDGARTYKGSIDNVRIYNQSLQVAEVEKIYAMEAPAHGIALK